ncbi:uncharacterized protein I303_108315 [Kwoniella dejecticola CBS 10117]|uniref:NF-kappa-B-activating protein C-terminal domain-containing protein n=1 Tax=Kwoniella dejecticola CBS 10117 TaxID=1296121 RepID=A0A1A5ZXQ9_9TREE|nr:uncharacterized protein I303_07358 [Kwoniella dejecticola CBS 10117]OBR82596.1 hypothetical protein I303_07358 [Kwoniella dejecticola CBS 10117]
MATVHPSRMGMVPGGSSSRPAPPANRSNGNGNPETPVSREEELRRKLMDRKRNGSERDGEGSHRDQDDVRRDRDRSPRYDDRGDDRRDRDRDRRDRSRERERRGDRDRDIEGERVRDRDGEGFRSYDSRRDERDRDRDNTRRDRDRRGSPVYENDNRPRRSSPSYKPFDPSQPSQGGNRDGYGYGRRDDLPSGPPGPGQDGRPNQNMPPPWVPKMQSQAPQQQGGYGGWQNPPPHQRFGTLDFERRRQERENNPLSIWPESPKRPYQDEDELEAERKKNKSKSKSSKKSKSKSSSKHKSSKHRSSRKYSDDSSSETDSEEEERRRRRRKEKERERKKKYDDYSDDSEEERRRKRRKDKDRRRTPDEDVHAAEEDMWVEKGEEVPAAKPATISPVKEKMVVRDEESDDEIGPQLPSEAKEKSMDRSAFAHMRPGEGEAMAAYAESGQRIPRRGEIGMEASTIEKFEQSGYVMSGSRHQRMNAVRMRKENQVINEAEKRAILKLQREEKEKKEGMIITQFKEMMEENLRKQGINRP